MNKLIILTICLIMFETCHGQEMPPFKFEDLPTDGGAGIGILDMTRIAIQDGVALYVTLESSVPFARIIFTKRTTGEEAGSYQITSGILGDKLRLYDMYEGDSDSRVSRKFNSGVSGKDPTLKFRVTSRTSGFWRVVINEQSNQTAYIKLSESNPLFGDRYALIHSSDKGAVAFEPWETILKDTRVVFLSDISDIGSGLEKSDGLLYDAPSGHTTQKIKEANFSKHFFRVLKVDGDWIEIAPNLKYRASQDANISGWVRWRNGKRLTVMLVREINL